MNWIDASPISSVPLTDDGDEFRRKVTSPVGWGEYGRMDRTKPSAYVEQEVVALGSGALGICGSIKPETAEARPLRRHAEGEGGRDFLSGTDR